MGKLAEKQYSQAIKRKKSGIADSGEVARYHSQWSTQRSSLLSLIYQHNQLLKKLKQLIPSLNGKLIKLAPYDLDNVLSLILSCSAKISSYSEAPTQFTPYYEIIEILLKEENLEKKIVKDYDNLSIKLEGEYAKVGRDYGFGSSGRDFINNSKERMSIGIKFSMPLGKQKRSIKEVKEQLIKKRYQSKVRSNLAKINAFHSETASMIKILQQVVVSQKETNKYLTLNLKVSMEKYNQARMSVQELISEQDAHLRSQLNEVDTNLITINTLLDYFGIFTDFPCDLNKI